MKINLILKEYHMNDELPYTSRYLFWGYLKCKISFPNILRVINSSYVEL